MVVLHLNSAKVYADRSNPYVSYGVRH